MTNTHTQAVREPNGDARIHMLNTTAHVVESPTNTTAWLIANRRHGAMLYSAPSTNGATLAVLGTPTYYKANAKHDDRTARAVNDADVAYIIATRPSLGQTDKDYNG
jgi:hypothetical protein